MSAPSEDKLLIREIAKRRVFLFFSVLTLLALSDAAITESDIFLHAIDDYAIITLSILSIILIVVWWKKQSLGELRKQHNIILIIWAVALLFQIFAFVQEINDPEDFGNEIPSLILILLILINRFV
jgi:hypothetical protein